MAILDELSKTTVRARCFFLGFVVNSVIRFIDDDRTRQLAQEAVRAINSWQTDPEESGGEDVYRWCGDTEDEDGLIFIEQLQPRGPEHYATLCVISAILYVAWHAFRAEGVEPPYASLASVDESVLGQTLGYAQRIPEYEFEGCESLMDFLIRNHPASASNEMGSLVVWYGVE